MRVTVITVAACRIEPPKVLMASVASVDNALHELKNRGWNLDFASFLLFKVFWQCDEVFDCNFIPGISSESC